MNTGKENFIGIVTAGFDNPFRSSYCRRWSTNWRSTGLCRR